MLNEFWRVDVMSIIEFRAGSSSLVASGLAVGAAAAATDFCQISRWSCCVVSETSLETRS